MISFSPYSTIKPFFTSIQDRVVWFPEEDRDRVDSYLKYDSLYWNDDTQFVLRVLAGEEPIYIPNARTIVDTTAHYLLKGLQVGLESPEKFTATNDALTNFLKREMFYSRFHTAKHAGVARGDFVMHLTADPSKPQGSRLSLNSVDPCQVIPVYDDDDLEKLIRVHLIDIYASNDPKEIGEKRIRKLTYEYEMVGNTKRVKRSEAIYKLDEKWWGQQPNLIRTIIPESLLPADINVIPVYWFQNLGWDGQKFGSSELRGFEKLIRGVSQATTDQEAALGLEGLGVYATDGGRPVTEDGQESDWEIAPGKVMEVPSGSYFRRVEGLSTLKPSMDHINYLESKLREAGGLSDVALGRVDVQTAQSGIALAIKFIPTLAKIEQRDLAGRERIQQLFHDWQAWYGVYENETLEGDIVASIGEKLPEDRTAKLNDLNNMLDRGVISKKFYRAEMTKLGWVFPDDIEEEIQREEDQAAENAAKHAPENLQQNALDAAKGNIPPPPGKGGQGTLPAKGSQSNNRNRPNESAGTEARQSPSRQARGGTPR
jgi:hypothetical protein